MVGDVKFIIVGVMLYDVEKRVFISYSNRVISLMCKVGDQIMGNGS